MSIDRFFIAEYVVPPPEPEEGEESADEPKEPEEPEVKTYTIDPEKVTDYFETFVSRFLGRAHLEPRKAGGRATAIGIERDRQETYDILVALREDLSAFENGSYTKESLDAFVQVASASVEDRYRLLEGDVPPGFSGRAIFNRQEVKYSRLKRVGRAVKGIFEKQEQVYLHKLSDRGQAVLAAVIYLRNTGRLTSLAAENEGLAKVMTPMGEILGNLDAKIEKYAPKTA